MGRGSQLIVRLGLWRAGGLDIGVARFDDCTGERGPPAIVTYVTNASAVGHRSSVGCCVKKGVAHAVVCNSQYFARVK